MDENTKRKYFERLQYINMYQGAYRSMQKKGMELLADFRNFMKGYKIEVDENNEFLFLGKKFQLTLEFAPMEAFKNGHFIANEVILEDGKRRLKPLIEIWFDSNGYIDLSPGTFQIVLGAIVDNTQNSDRLSLM